jgi:hypothetical protein
MRSSAKRFALGDLHEELGQALCAQGFDIVEVQFRF